MIATIDRNALEREQLRAEVADLKDRNAMLQDLADERGYYAAAVTALCVVLIITLGFIFAKGVGL